MDVIEGEVRRDRSLGLDPIKNFWYKEFTSTRARIAGSINQVVSRAEEVPPIFTALRTMYQKRHSAGPCKHETDYLLTNTN